MGFCFEKSKKCHRSLIASVSKQRMTGTFLIDSWDVLSECPAAPAIEEELDDWIRCLKHQWGDRSGGEQATHLKADIKSFTTSTKWVWALPVTRKNNWGK